VDKSHLSSPHSKFKNTHSTPLHNESPSSSSSRTEFNDYACPLVCAVFVALCPLWVLIARRIPSTRELLYSGWEPVIIAMAISRYITLSYFTCIKSQNTTESRRGPEREREREKNEAASRGTIMSPTKEPSALKATNDAHF